MQKHPFIPRTPPKKKAKIIDTKPKIEKRGIIAVENLPYPLVNYPGAWGYFIAFQLDKTLPIYLCSCSKLAVENYFKMLKGLSSGTKKIMIGFEADNDSSGDFPYLFLTQLKRKRAKIKKYEEYLDDILYENSLCHVCNGIVPAYRYSGGYGSTFEQHYGWYLYQQAFEFGVSRGGNIILPEACPQEIREMAIIPSEEIKKIWDDHEIYRKVDENEAKIILHEALKPVKKQQKKIMDYIENIVREKFGHKKIGEAWINETMLYYIVSTLYPEKTVLRHHHPNWLKGLELDIYLPDDNIGIEYQGLQHFEPIDNWGGAEGLKKVQERDKLKKKYCAANQTKLIYFYHYDVFSDDFVKNKIDELMNMYEK